MEKILKRYTVLWIILSVILIISIVFSFGVGRYSGAGFHELFSFLFSSSVESDKAVFVLFQLRGPRIISAAIVGAAMASSGTVYQALFSNPIVSPDNLGVTYAASFGAVVSLMLGLSSGMMKGIAFLMGCLAVFLVYMFSRMISKGRNLTLYLILIGMVVSSIFSALLSVIKYIADPEDQLPQITYWLMGSLSKVQPEDIPVVAIVFLVGIFPIILFRWKLNLLSLSDEEAVAMGVNKKMIQAVVVLCATLLTAVSTSITGGINWIGLIIPHFSRILVGNDYRNVTIASMLLGSIFLVWLDNIARCISINEIPISVLTSLIGAPLFLILMIKNRERVVNGY